MADTLPEHGNNVQRNVDQGVGTSMVGPSTDHRGDAESLECRVTPHRFTSCGGICNGPSFDFQDDGLLHFVSKTRLFSYYILFHVKIFNCFTIYFYLII